MSTEQIETLLAKQALHELNVRYCCGVDRSDKAMLEPLWWPEATIDFGLFAGSAQQFCELISAPNPALEVSFHFTSNELFEVSGERATGSIYVIGVTSTRLDGKMQDQLVGGRYLDTYARRGGVWKFTRRLFVMDWNINQPGSANWADGIGAAVTRGQRSRADAFYSNTL
jgi:hypothetical protein